MPLLWWAGMACLAALQPPHMRYAPPRMEHIAKFRPRLARGPCSMAISGVTKLSGQREEPDADDVIEAENRRKEAQEIIALAGPALLGTLIDPFLSLVDTMYVGRIGGSSSLALGAVAAASELFTLCLAVSLALREAASSTLARLMADGKNEEAARFASRCLQLAFLAGTILALVFGGPLAPACVGVMGAPVGSPLHADALVYARVRACALPVAIALPAAEGIFRGIGNTRVPLNAAAISALVNFVLDPLFIFKPLNLRVGGAAAATAVAQLVAFLVLFRKLRSFLASGRVLPVRDAADTAGSAEGTQMDEAAVSAKEEQAATRRLVGTSLATVLRSSSVIGCWVFIASTIGRQLGPSAIAAHGIVLKVWLLMVLAAEAPAVAGQVLCARHITTGTTARARRLLLRLLRSTSVMGALSAVALLALAAPVSRIMIPSDPGLAASTAQLFRWASLSTPLVAPNALLEGVLLGAGRSYRYLATSTLAIALSIAALTSFAVRVRPFPSSAWACIFLFFLFRLVNSARRVFLYPQGGFGDWWGNDCADKASVETADKASVETADSVRNMND